jgi:hypothetical protein
MELYMFWLSVFFACFCKYTEISHYTQNALVICLRSQYKSKNCVRKDITSNYLLLYLVK